MLVTLLTSVYNHVNLCVEAVECVLTSFYRMPQKV